MRPEEKEAMDTAMAVHDQILGHYPTESAPAEEEPFLSAPCASAGVVPVRPIGFDSEAPDATIGSDNTKAAYAPLGFVDSTAAPEVSSDDALPPNRMTDWPEDTLLPVQFPGG